MGATAYWRAGEMTGDPSMREAARGMLEFVLNKAPRAADGTCYHVAGAPEMWWEPQRLRLVAIYPGCTSFSRLG